MIEIWDGINTYKYKIFSVKIVNKKSNHMDIKTSDYIVDLGPEGGDGGGTVVCSGTPEKVAECEKSYTGQFLKRILKANES